LSAALFDNRQLIIDDENPGVIAPTSTSKPKATAAGATQTRSKDGMVMV